MAEATSSPLPISDEQVADLLDEALDPALSKDWVMFGEGEHAKRCQVRYLNLRAERRIAKALAPHLHLLNGIETGNLAGMGAIIEQLADVLPECVAAAFDRDGITVEWLDEHATSKQVLEAVRSQLGKMALADLLGKLFRTGGPSS